jgi:hypothetical protein
MTRFLPKVLQSAFSQPHRQALMLLALVGVGTGIWLGCSRREVEPPPESALEPALEEPAQIPAPPETVLVSSDGRSSLTLPPSWTPQSDLHDSAELQAANTTQQLYVIVLSESKTTLQTEKPDVDWTLETHAQTTRQLLEEPLQATGEIQVGEPVPLTVGDYPALQYDLRGTLGDLEVVYFHTTVETPTRFHQILGWTVPAQLEEYQGELEQVIQSFQEVDQDTVGNREGDRPVNAAPAAGPASEAPNPE